MKQKNTKAITSPSINSVVRHTGWGQEGDKNYPCDVLIIEGDFMIGGRISNWWRWRRISSDGILSDNIESGYGDFEKTDNQYEVIIQVKQIKPKKRKKKIPRNYFFSWEKL